MANNTDITLHHSRAADFPGGKRPWISYTRQGVMIGGAFASQLVAIVASIALMITAQIAGYLLLMILGIIFQGDPGGLLTVILVPIFAVIVATGITVMVFVPVGLAFLALRHKKWMAWWVPTAIVLLPWIVIPVAVAVGLSAELSGSNSISTAAWMTVFFCTAMGAIGAFFLFYWTVLCAGMGGSWLMSGFVGKFAESIAKRLGHPIPSDEPFTPTETPAVSSSRY
jgi:hypothetical protein